MIRKQNIVKKIQQPAPVKHKPLGKATSASILGHSIQEGPKEFTSNAVIKPEWIKYYRNLLQLRERLLSQMSGLAKESAEEMSSYSLHMADSGTDNFDRDFALSLLSSDQDAIYEIDEALKRIERDAYGICETSGKHIPAHASTPSRGLGSQWKPRRNSKKKEHCVSVGSDNSAA